MNIQIYAMNITGKDYLNEIYAPYLSETRRSEALKRKNPQDRQLYLAAEVLLNMALEQEDAGIPLPAVYRRNPYGKPYLYPDIGIHVNWSHSGTWVICAVSDRETGIDLQDTSREPKEALIRRMLQPEERSFYEKTPDAQKKRLFYEYWAVKESYLKAVGTGFHTPLDTFYVRMEGKDPQIIKRSGGRAYTCRLLDFADKGYTAACCMEQERGEEQKLTGKKIQDQEEERAKKRDQTGIKKDAGKERSRTQCVWDGQPDPVEIRYL